MNKALMAIGLGGILGAIVAPFFWLWFVDFQIKIWTGTYHAVVEVLENVEINIEVEESDEQTKP